MLTRIWHHVAVFFGFRGDGRLGYHIGAAIGSAGLTLGALNSLDAGSPWLRIGVAALAAVAGWTASVLIRRD